MFLLDESLIDKFKKKMNDNKANKEAAEREEFKEWLSKMYCSKKEWDSKYRSDFIKTYKSCIIKSKKLGKSLKNGKFEKDKKLGYPDIDNTWKSSDDINFMDNFKGGPNDQRDGICTKSMSVLFLNLDSIDSEQEKEKIYNNVVRELEGCIPKEYSNEREKMFFRILKRGNFFVLMANSIIM